MPTFDVVSEVDLAELSNAINTARKEIVNRYDFKGTNTEIDQSEAVITITTVSNQKLDACLEVIRQKMTRRGVPVESLDYGKVESASGNRVRQVARLKEGIDTLTAKKIVKALKEHDKKLQASIHGETVRVSSKNRDDLQAAIAFLKGNDYGVALQYKNFRDK